MTRENIEDHLMFLDTILKEVSGMKAHYLDGRNEKVRNQADRNLNKGVRQTRLYLERNPSLVDFLLELEGCDPEFLDYPRWNRIEGDTLRYMQALRNKLREIE